MFDGLAKEQVKEAFADVITEAVQNELTDLTISSGEDYIKAGINKVLDDFMNGEKTSIIVDNLKKNLSVRGVAETTVYSVINVVSAPTKPIRDLLFFTNKAINLGETAQSIERTAIVSIVFRKF